MRECVCVCVCVSDEVDLRVKNKPHSRVKIDVKRWFKQESGRKTDEDRVRHTEKSAPTSDGV